MKKRIIITENQLSKLIDRIDEEAAGYDDYDQMMQHGGVSMGLLIDTLKDLSLVFNGIANMLGSENIEYIDLSENLKEAVDLIDEINKVTKIVFQDFTDKEVIRTGEILHRKLESYQEKIRMLIGMGEELLSKESLVEKLAMMTENVMRYVEDYAYKLQDADITFRKRLEKGKPFRGSNWN